MMNDLISRQAVFDIVDDLRDQMTVEGYWSVVERVKALPSAQPETHDKRTETHSCDCVSRQAVQEIVDRIGGMYPYRQIGNRDSYSQYNEAWTDAINRVGAELNSLPSAQPEIVKCKKCRYVYYDKDFDNYWCVRISGSFKVEADDFCSKAERRTNECID